VRYSFKIRLHQTRNTVEARAVSRADAARNNLSNPAPTASRGRDDASACSCDGGEGVRAAADMKLIVAVPEVWRTVAIKFNTFSRAGCSVSNDTITPYVWSGALCVL
jgi:hypothetical protein